MKPRDKDEARILREAIETIRELRRYWEPPRAGEVQGADAAQLERAFYRAAVRTVLRRWLPWIARPVAELLFERAER